MILGQNRGGVGSAAGERDADMALNDSTNAEASGTIKTADGDGKGAANVAEITVDDNLQMEVDASQATAAGNGYTSDGANAEKYDDDGGDVHLENESSESDDDRLTPGLFCDIAPTVVFDIFSLISSFGWNVFLFHHLSTYVRSTGC